MKNTLSKKESQVLVWRFINEFRDRVVANFSNLIDFIIIYGSSVRGEFVPGKSDVDIVIEIFKEADKKMIEKVCTELFWEVAKRYPALGFEDSLSVSDKKNQGPLAQALEKMEQANLLFVPIFIFAKGEIDWQNGQLHSDNPMIKIGQALLIPQRKVFMRFKKEGKILFGRDIRKDIHIHLTLIDRLRSVIAPAFLSFMGFILSPFVPSKAEGYAVKALLYQIDDLFSALAEYKSMARDQKIDKNQKMLLNEFTERLQKFIFIKLDHSKGMLKSKHFKLVDKAVAIKWGELKLSRLQVIGFTFRAWVFVIKSNLRALGLIFLRRR